MKHKASRIIAAIGLLAALFVLTAAPSCNQQQSAVSLLTTAGQLTDNWLAVYDPSYSRVTVDAAFQAAINAVQTQGTPCQAVLSAVNSVSVVLNGLPQMDPQAKLLLMTIISSVDLVASQFAQCAPVATAPKGKAQASIGNVATAPRSSQELKQRWAALGGP